MKKNNCSVFLGSLMIAALYGNVAKCTDTQRNVVYQKIFPKI